jgi:protein-glutamine gamma-glutamyltransferase
MNGKQNRNLLLETSGLLTEVLSIIPFMTLFNGEVIFVAAILLILVAHLVFGWSPDFGIPKKMEAPVLLFLQIISAVIFAVSRDVYFAAAVYLSFAQVSFMCLKEKRTYQGLVWSFLCVVICARFNIELPFFVFLLLFLPVSFVYLHELNRSRAAESLHYRLSFRQVILHALIFFVLIGCSSVLFLAIPRMNIPPMFSSRMKRGEVGFSEMTDLSSIGMLRKTGRLALRYRSPRPFYLRGKAYDTFTGTGWESSFPEQARIDVPQRSSRDIMRISQRFPVYETQVIDLKGAGSVVFAPAGLLQVTRSPSRVLIDPNGNLTLLISYRYGREYTFLSIDPPALSFSDSRLYKEVNLKNPSLNLDTSRMSKRAKDLSRLLLSKEKGFIRKVSAALRFFADFDYTLDAGKSGEDPLDHFLFESREGHCELFATGLAMLLREAGIPTRYVTGYAPSESNKREDEYFVFEDDAHAWVEVFFPDYGWIPVDPTPAMAGAGVGFERITALIKDLNIYWNYYIVTYSQQRQIRLFSLFKLGVRKQKERISEMLEKARGALGLPYFLPASGVFLLMLACFIAARRKKGSRLAPSSNVSFYRKYEKNLRGKGFRRSPGETPLSFSKRARSQETGASHDLIVTSYYRTRFGGKTPDKTLLKKIYAALREL